MSELGDLMATFPNVVFVVEDDLGTREGEIIVCPRANCGIAFIAARDLPRSYRVVCPQLPLAELQALPNYGHSAEPVDGA